MVNTRRNQRRQPVVADGPAANVTTALGPNNSDGNTSGIHLTARAGFTYRLHIACSIPTIATTPTIRRDWHNRKLAIRENLHVQRKRTEVSSCLDMSEDLRGTSLASILRDTS